MSTFWVLVCLMALFGLSVTSSGVAVASEQWGYAVMAILWSLFAGALFVAIAVSS